MQDPYVVVAAAEPYKGSIQYAVLATAEPYKVRSKCAFRYAQAHNNKKTNPMWLLPQPNLTRFDPSVRFATLKRTIIRKQTLLRGLPSQVKGARFRA
jgi:hypothetical protein